MFWEIEFDAPFLHSRTPLRDVFWCSSPSRAIPDNAETGQVPYHYSMGFSVHSMLSLIFEEGLYSKRQSVKLLVESFGPLWRGRHVHRGDTLLRRTILSLPSKFNLPGNVRALPDARSR